MRDDADDVVAIEALIKRQFSSLDWRPGKAADWDSFTADFFPDALLYPASRPTKRQTVQEFVERMKGLSSTKLESFHEVVLGTEIRVFGNVAVALAACEMTENDAQVEPWRGDDATHQERGRMADRCSSMGHRGCREIDPGGITE